MNLRTVFSAAWGSVAAPLELPPGSYDVVVSADNPELKLLPGMTANVTVTYAQASGVK